jgi:hypothetical protein
MRLLVVVRAPKCACYYFSRSGISHSRGDFFAQKSFLLATVTLLAATRCSIAHTRQRVSVAAPPDFVSERNIARKISFDGISNFGEVTLMLYGDAQPGFRFSHT